MAIGDQWTFASIGEPGKGTEATGKEVQHLWSACCVPEVDEGG